MNDAIFLVSPAGEGEPGYVAQFVGPDESVVCQAATLDDLMLRVLDACAVHFDEPLDSVTWKFKLERMSPQ